MLTSYLYTYILYKSGFGTQSFIQTEMIFFTIKDNLLMTFAKYIFSNSNLEYIIIIFIMIEGVLFFKTHKIKNCTNYDIEIFQ